MPFLDFFSPPTSTFWKICDSNMWFSWSRWLLLNHQLANRIRFCQSLKYERTYFFGCLKSARICFYFVCDYTGFEETFYFTCVRYPATLESARALNLDHLHGRQSTCLWELLYAILIRIHIIVANANLDEYSVLFDSCSILVSSSAFARAVSQTSFIVFWQAVILCPNCFESEDSSES